LRQRVFVIDSVWSKTVDRVIVSIFTEYNECEEVKSQDITQHYRGLMADRSKTWVCGRSLAGIAVSNPAGSMDACLLCVAFATG
jgi:hypothetical protein